MKKSSYTNLVLGLFFVIFLLLVGVGSADAADPVKKLEPEKLGEMHQRHAKYCSIYRVVVGDDTFIMTTCGGILLLPKGG